MQTFGQLWPNGLESCLAGFRTLRTLGSPRSFLGNEPSKVWEKTLIFSWWKARDTFQKTHKVDAHTRSGGGIPPRWPHFFGAGTRRSGRLHHIALCLY